MISNQTERKKTKQKKNTTEEPEITKFPDSSSKSNAVLSLLCSYSLSLSIIKKKTTSENLKTFTLFPSLCVITINNHTLQTPKPQRRLDISQTRWAESSWQLWSDTTARQWIINVWVKETRQCCSTSWAVSVQIFYLKQRRVKKKQSYKALYMHNINERTNKRFSCKTLSDSTLTSYSTVTFFIFFVFKNTNV